jgi:prepilin-type N-terminal cleavage/methylation domain-containing protein
VDREIRAAPKAFTLVEVVAVLLIIGLLAGLSVVGLRARSQAATLEALTAELCDFDRAARLRAERSAQPMELEIDAQRVSLRSADGRQMLRPPLDLPGGFAIESCWMGGSDGTDREMTVAIGPQGRSSSYGFCVARSDGKKRWIVVSGLSGQAQIAESDEQSKVIMALLAQKRLTP